MNYIKGQISRSSQRLFYRSFRKIKETHSTHESPCLVNLRSQETWKRPLFSTFQLWIFLSPEIVLLAIFTFKIWFLFIILFYLRMLLGAIHRKGNNSSIVLLSRSNSQALTSLSLSLSNVKCTKANDLDAAQKSWGWISHDGEHEGPPERRVSGEMQGTKSNRNKNNNIF